MATANMAAIVAEAWDEARCLGDYGNAPLTVGYYHGEAYVKIWNFRTGWDEWRRFPSRDVPDGTEPMPRHADIFASSYLWEALR